MLDTVIRSIRYLSPRNDDSDVDRLHYCLTSNVLIALSLLISYKQFGGRPIECMVPKMFPSSWEEVRRYDVYETTVSWTTDRFSDTPKCQLLRCM
ncbi:unnamed protein product [Soboliphyme baturini]|uniref:Innexin n=1 Tax=Soboliphyme baturini TaxID=241478 RepID=A0A183IVB3_9BILA|nr:unnamed protein product [Soboliphyme baturini]